MNFDHYVCEGQMSMFDLLPRESKDFTKMTIAEIADEIGRNIGLTFQQDKRKGWKFDTWFTEYRGVRFEIHLSKYYEGCVPETNHTEDGSFIGVSAQKKYCGPFGPTDSLDEAIDFFKKEMEKANDNKEHKRNRKD